MNFLGYLRFDFESYHAVNLLWNIAQVLHQKRALKKGQYLCIFPSKVMDELLNNEESLLIHKAHQFFCSFQTHLDARQIQDGTFWWEYIMLLSKVSQYSFAHNKNVHDIILHRPDISFCNSVFSDRTGIFIILPQAQICIFSYSFFAPKLNSFLCTFCSKVS